MPIAYELDPVNNIIRERWWGTITPLDMVHHWGELVKDPLASNFSRHLVDIREAEPGFDEARFWSLVDDFYREHLGRRQEKIAVLVATKIQLSVARGWKLLTFTSVATGIFSNPDKALHWLLAHF
jgi:hypothetical protein